MVGLSLSPEASYGLKPYGFFRTFLDQYIHEHLASSFGPVEVLLRPYYLI
jgi:hypothetical protein